MDAQIFINNKNDRATPVAQLSEQGWVEWRLTGVRAGVGRMEIDRISAAEILLCLGVLPL